MLKTKTGLLKNINYDRVNIFEIYNESKIWGEEKTSTPELKKV